jgi:hypothetical protein
MAAMNMISRTFCSKSKAREVLQSGSFTIELYDSINNVEELWSSIAPQDIFFSIEFLRCVERYAPSGIQPFYGIVRDHRNPVGIIYLQSKYVRLRENLRKPGAAQKTGIKYVTDPIKKAVVHALNFHTIVCGNLLLTGKYGFFFQADISGDQQFLLVSKTIDQLAQHLRKQGIKTGLMLIKDFFEAESVADNIPRQDYTRFSVQPKMILSVDPKWKSLEDYMEDLKSKYRIRIRKALEKAADIEKVEFGVEEIRKYRKSIHRLYKNVSDQADFNAFILHEQYFEHLKEALGSQMTFTAYFREGQMIAFHTSIRNFGVLDAHFLGYEPNLNQTCHLYLNMLIDLLCQGIKGKVEIIDMSRTAIEIKSTLGAQPHDMYLYLKHTNHILNKTVSSILSLVKPQQDYIIRQPFRTEG